MYIYTHVYIFIYICVYIYICIHCTDHVQAALEPLKGAWARALLRAPWALLRAWARALLGAP